MKEKNLLFFITLIIAFLLLGLFNYMIDPYYLKTTPHRMGYAYYYPESILNSILRIQKKQKFDYFIIGGSTPQTFFYPFREMAFLFFEEIDFNKLNKYLKFYSDLHPEIKTVYLPLEYNILYQENKPIEFNSTLNIEARDIFNVYFSLETLERSIDKFKISHINNKIKKNPKFGHHHSFLNLKFNEKALNEYSELFKTFNTQNKNTICYILPYHALFQAKIYVENDYNQIEKFKRLAVNNCNQVFDFSFINPITEIPLKQNYFFWDICHPNQYYAELLLPLLDNNTNKISVDRDLYYILTKDNIESVLKTERNRLEKYVKENRQYIDEFLSYDNWKYVEVPMEEINKFIDEQYKIHKDKQ